MAQDSRQELLKQVSNYTSGPLYRAHVRVAKPQLTCMHRRLRSGSGCMPCSWKRSGTGPYGPG